MMEHRRMQRVITAHGEEVLRWTTETGDEERDRRNTEAIRRVHQAALSATAPGPTFLPAISDDTPCDGSHGRFCPECAGIVRNSTLGKVTKVTVPVVVANTKEALK